MTAFKPTISAPASPVPKYLAKKAGSAKLCSAAAAAAAERKSIDAPLQGISNTHRRYARRGSKTPGMLGASAARLVFDFDREQLESVSEITLLNALQIREQKDSKTYNPAA